MSVFTVCITTLYIYSHTIRLSNEFITFRAMILILISLNVFSLKKLFILLQVLV